MFANSFLLEKIKGQKQNKEGKTQRTHWEDHCFAISYRTKQKRESRGRRKNRRKRPETAFSLHCIGKSKQRAGKNAKKLKKLAIFAD